MVARKRNFALLCVLEAMRPPPPQDEDHLFLTKRHQQFVPNAELDVVFIDTVRHTRGNGDNAPPILCKLVENIFHRLDFMTSNYSEIWIFSILYAWVALLWELGGYNLKIGKIIH